MFQSKHWKLLISANLIVSLDHGFYKFISKSMYFVFYVEVYKCTSWAADDFDLKFTVQLHLKGWTNIYFCTKIRTQRPHYIRMTQWHKRSRVRTQYRHSVYLRRFYIGVWMGYTPISSRSTLGALCRHILISPERNLLRVVQDHGAV